MSSSSKPKSSRKPKYNPLKRFDRKTNKKLNTEPIDDSMLSIREMKSSDKPNLANIINNFKRDYYVNIYRFTFRSWFTYLTVACLLAVSLSLISSSMPSICLPPFLVTVFLIWKVNRYKRVNRTFNSGELEMLMQNEALSFKYKSSAIRRINQGVYLAFLKQEKSIDDYDLDELDTDMDTSSEEEAKSQSDDKNKTLVGYLVYTKQRDELETVCLKEICIHKDYRQRSIAKNFVRRVCQNVFRDYGYKRVVYTASSFHTELTTISKAKPNLIKKICSWIAWTLVPGVHDERTVYAFEIDKLTK